MRHQTYRAFWDFYVQEHLTRGNRLWHFWGTSIALGFVAVTMATGHGWWFVGAPVSGYGCAWIGHYFVEHNRPATFQYPIWSLVGDFQMYYLMWRGQMDHEIARVQELKKSA